MFRAIALAAWIAAGIASAQSECPLKQDEVLKLACSRQTLKEKVDAVNRRGVAFEIDLPFAKTLNAQCGQQVELIRAIEKSYKAGCVQADPPPPEPPKAEETLPDGPALTRHQVVLLLDAKVDQAKIIKLIEKRKVDFAIGADREAAAELKEAGAGAALLGALVIHGAK